MRKVGICTVTRYLSSVGILALVVKSQLGMAASGVMSGPKYSTTTYYRQGIRRVAARFYLPALVLNVP